MSLLEQWRKMAYDEGRTQQAQQMFWANYFNLEKEVYAKILRYPSEPVKGTVKELSEKFDLDLMYKILELMMVFVQ